MNRTYKVIWSKARRCYVVVSELAKSQHKSSTKSEHISSNVHRGYLGKAAAAAVVASLLTFGGMAYSPVMAEDNTTVTDNNGNEVTNNEVTNTDSKNKDINANITGKNNKVTDSSNAEIVGDGNTVTNEAKGEDGSVRYVRSDDARIHGSGNTISASRNQQVIGDNNTIMGRDDGTVTDYQHPEGREPNVSDLTIGRGNFIRSTDTYRNEWDSLKVIGNNNRADFKIESAGGPAAGIVIGDNQNIDGIKDSIVIGSLSPDEQKEQVGEDRYKSDKYFIGSNSIVVGYHATSSKDASTVIGNRSKVSGNYQTVTGLRSTIEGNYYNSLNLLDGQSGNFASIYGSFNKIEDATGEDDMDGVGNSINGSMNVTSNARGTMIMGVGNTVTHSKGEFLIPKDDDSSISTGDLLYVGAFTASDYAQGRDITGDNLTYPADQVYAYMRDAWQRYMETSGGAVSVLGNSNTSDYAIRSQILGTNNMLKGAEGNISSYNTISGFSNTGENVKRTAIVGTGNTLKNSEDNVVIGDYHNLENGRHNVVLGSMASEEKPVTKTAKAAWAATDDNPDGTYTYTVNEQVALKPNTKDIENAVMVGYNTDVTKNGGVALGSDSIASTGAGKTGYDAKGKKHAKSDKDYAAWVSTDAAVSVGGADRKVTYDVLDKDGNPVIDKATGKTKQETQIVKSTRQITNLAAGTEETDAVNVAQMKVTATAAADAVKTHFYSVNSTDAKAGNYNNNGATGVNAIAAGVGASSDGDSSIAVGTNAKIESNGVSLTSIAIGKNAYVLNGSGNQEYQFSFDKDNWPDGKPNAKGVENLSGGIAIGTNTYARTGSIDVGGRTMKGRQMAGITIDKDGGSSTANIMDMTTVGTNSYNKGLMATIVGSYSINTGDFNGKGGLNSYFYGSQNMGSTIVGSLNQNRSLGKVGTSGVANSIIGVANVAEGANGALIFGAGNKVSNSIKSISGFDGNYGADTVDDLVDSLSSAVKESESGGSTLVIGGGNTADYTQRTQLIGVNNTITGTSKKISDYNMVDGFNITANNISHVYTIGYRNDFNNENNSIVIGDYHQLKNGKNNVVIGSYDGSYQPAGWNKPESTTYLTNDKLEDAVILGHNANVTVNGGVALGAGSVASVDNASTDANAIGYDPATKKASTDTSSTWKSTAAAVSVGDASKNITRQITNVAAGTQDTDAVNVAQLKAISSTMNTDIAASKTHFYSVNSTDEKAKNYDNKGATAANALAAGVGAQALKDSAVAIGDAAHAESSNSVVIGTGAWTRSSNGDKLTANGGDVAIGQKAYIDSYVNQGGSIALGQNARVENTNGSTERKYAFGQTGFEGDNIPLNPGNEAGGVAIGRNSFARTGSLMVGSHMYKGAIADMDEVDGTDSQKLRDNFNNINMTTLGTNSFNNGTFATVTGSYSATTAKKKTQNFAATVAGSLNSIESYKDADDNSGVASSIVGTANRIANSNNTTILGAGNEVTNSLTDFKAPTEGGASAKALQDTLKNTLQKDAKGAVVVSGIGNKVDSANSISLSGSRNTIKNTKNAQIFGDNREVTNSNGVIIIGSADKTLKTTNVQNSTIIGHNANAQNDALAVGESAKAGNNSIAIGMQASAGYSQNMALGYHASVADGVTNSTALGYGSQVTKRDILKSDGNDGVVSVGKSVGQSGEAGMTRRIINVKAGVNDTDAVNVSQLKGVQDGLTHFYSVGSQDETAGNYNNDGAKGKNSLAAGVGALANGSNSVAIGTNAKAQNDALAVGESASAGNDGIAIGMHANAGYGQNMALGYYANVENRVQNSTALGYGSQVTNRDILKSDGSDGVISVGKSVGQSGEKGMTRRIINVKAGVNDTDAVNVSQLKQQAQAATTEVVAGTNIVSVTKNNDKTPDGHTIYKVNAKGTTVSGDDNFNITPKTDGVTNVTDYAISLNNTITIGSGTGTHPITINGTDGVVSGLTNTTWDKNADYSKSTKAATEAQLQTAMKDAQEAAEANDTDTHVKAGTYAVTTVKDAAGKETQGVALDVVDKTGTSVGKVTITDVAKASDVGDVSKLSKEIQNAKGSTTVVDAINNVNTKVNTVDNKVGDLNYSSTHYVKSGDNVTTSISNLDKAIHDATTEAEKHHSTVSEGNNIKVTPTTTDGKTDYKVSLSDDINVNSVTAKAVTATTVTTDNLAVNKSATIGKVTIDGKGTIGGLINKTWDAKNITSGQAATEDQLKAATKNAINYDGDNSNTITLREDTTIKNVADTTIEEGSKNAVNAGTVYKATKNAINYDGDDSQTITLRKDTTINNVADTTIEQGSKNAVNAGTVYNETRVAKDGNFVKQANTAGENLSALDNQVTANTESIYHINNRVSDLDNRVNKVGAGAAALAALHPLDFDPDDKWDFAVGYGNYRNANSVAFGAFYRPNEDTMFSLGTNFGNGENMFNAGLSFKIGQGSGITTSKTAMAKKIESLEDTVDKQDKKIAELEALVKEQGEMIRQYVGKK